MTEIISDGKGLYPRRLERLKRAAKTSSGPEWTTTVLTDDLRALLAEIGEASPGQDPYVEFGEVAHKRLQEQTQYASRYLEGRHGYPNLGKGLRWEGDLDDYHFIRIHKDDVDEFVRRVEEYRRNV